MALDRRTLAAGAAWATPAVAFAAAAPAMAASLPPGSVTLAVTGFTQYFPPDDSFGCVFSFNAATAWRDGPPGGIDFIGATAATKILDLTVTFSLAFNTAAFPLDTTYGDWTPAKLTGKTDTYRGTTLYDYSSTLWVPFGAERITTPTGIRVKFLQTSNSALGLCVGDVNANDHLLGYFISVSARIDGVVQTVSGGYQEWP